MRINRQIRAPKVRVINSAGEQVGIISISEAMKMAETEELDLVEVVPNAAPPVCKIIDYGKFRYDQARREKENRKASHQIKLKEVKVRPNINEHDLQVKLKRAREFLDKGYKVKVTCMMRGREMAHPEIGHKIVKKTIDALTDIAALEAPVKQFGRIITTVMAPLGKGVKKKTT